MKKFEIPEIPHDLVQKAKLQNAKIYSGADWKHSEPVISISWDRPDFNSDGYVIEPKRMVEDPEYDLTVQLKTVKTKIDALNAGSTGPGSFPTLNLIHFGTGPIATAFGSKMMMNTGIQPHFDPAFHDAQSALELEPADLRRGGWLGRILDRIEYYNEATQGKIPITISDNAGPWSIATSIWHFEDMLEGIYTNPEAVHHILSLATRSIIEVNEMQMECARNSWGRAGDTTGGSWYPRGIAVGDDVMVTVSTQMWKEFFLPYNEILSKYYGGIIYHCCMKHDWQLQAMSETVNFMGLDADPGYNDLEKIKSALLNKGVWNRPLYDYDLIRGFFGKCGFFLGVHGKDKRDALEKAERMREFVAGLE